MNDLGYLFLQLFVFVVLAPLVNGIIRKVKAFTQKRKGPPLFQMYYDLHKLFKKSSVISDKASWVFKAAPIALLSSSLVAALLVPVCANVLPKSFTSDMILMIYLLAAGRFFMMLAGLDTAGTFGGMGSSREAMISALIEPSILVSLFTVGLIAKSTSLSVIIGKMQTSGFPLLHPVYILCFIAMFIIIMAETARTPFDDPATHLELTMVHEAMLLEYSGRRLALMELGASVKQLIFITLLVNIFLPGGPLFGLTGLGAVALSLLWFIVKVAAVAFIMGIAEVSMVKLRLFSIPNIAALAFILSFIGFLQYFIFGR